MTRLPPTDLARVLKAADFAAARHRDQRRKGPEAEPYVNHLIEVAHLLAQSTYGHDTVLIAGGFLHDTIEDTATTHDELVLEFGREIADLVAEVTDDKRLIKSERKRLQETTITQKSARAQLLSIADKTANIGSLVRGAPMDWTRGRIIEYGAWAERCVAQVRGRDAVLDKAFGLALAQFDRRYGADR